MFIPTSARAERLVAPVTRLGAFALATDTKNLYLGDQGHLWNVRLPDGAKRDAIPRRGEARGSGNLETVARSTTGWQHSARRPHAPPLARRAHPGFRSRWLSLDAAGERWPGAADFARHCFGIGASLFAGWPATRLRTHAVWPGFS